MAQPRLTITVQGRSDADAKSLASHLRDHLQRIGFRVEVEEAVWERSVLLSEAALAGMLDAEPPALVAVQVQRG